MALCSAFHIKAMLKFIDEDYVASIQKSWRRELVETKTHFGVLRRLMPDLRCFMNQVSSTIMEYNSLRTPVYIKMIIENQSFQDLMHFQTPFRGLLELFHGVINSDGRPKHSASVVLVRPQRNLLNHFFPVQLMVRWIISNLVWYRILLRLIYKYLVTNLFRWFNFSRILNKTWKHVLFRFIQ